MGNILKSNAESDELRKEADALFSNKEFRKSVMKYNESLCYAEPNSKEMALAYAKRSLVFWETSMYLNCIESIDLAIASGYPAKRINKLKDCRQKCVEMMKVYGPDKNFNPWSYFKLSHPANEKLPFIINSLELRENEKYGRHIITNMDLKTGDVIAIEEPFDIYKTRESSFTHCHNCFRRNNYSLIPCTTRLEVMFCSTECMNKDFKPNCLSSPTPKLINHCIQIVGGLKELNKLVISEGNEKKTVFDFDLSRTDDPSYDKNRLIAICSLMQKDSEDVLAKENLSEICWIDAAQRTTEDSDFLLRFANRIARISAMNAINVEEKFWPEDEHIYGVAMFPFSSLISHSCIPNLHRMCVDNKLVLIVAHPIKAGEQVFINYRGIEFCNRDLNQRRELLQDYQFVCNCDACVYDWKADKLPKKDDNLQQFVKILNSKKAILESIKVLSEYIENNYENWPSEELHMLMHLHLHYCHQLGEVVFKQRMN